MIASLRKAAAVGPLLLVLFLGSTPAKLGSAPTAPMACSLPGASAQTLHLQVRYRLNPPRRVDAEATGVPDVCLQHDPDLERFSGHYPVSAQISRVSIIAQLSDEGRLVVPLEPAYRTSPLVFALPIPSSTPCRPASVARLASAVGSRDAALAAAYQARFWYREAPDCPKSMKGEVARVWFDRSFEAVQREDSFVLDGDAANALVRERPDQRTYVQGMIEEYRKIVARKKYRHQLALARGGRTLEALAVNNAILAAIASDADSARLYNSIDIDSGRLRDDAAYFVGRASLDSAAVSAMHQQADASVAHVVTAADIFAPQ